VIPKEWPGSDFYRDLGVNSYASLEEIKSAYRNLVRELHPDVNPDVDSREKFRKVTLAYTVLSDDATRKKYDDFLFGEGDIPLQREYATKEIKNRKFFGLIGRVALFIIMLLILRSFGFSIPQSSTPAKQGGISSALQKLVGNGNNEILALMVGPQGPPGPAGVAGKNGFIGLNGYQGKDGLPGAPGAVGEQGPIGPAGPQGLQGLPGLPGAAGLAGLNGQNVTISTASSDQCNAGGYVLSGKDTSGATVSVPVCNGSGGGGGSGILGTGYVNVGACDSNVKISLESAFINDEFKMSAIIIDQLSGNCDGQLLTATLKVKSGTIDGTSGTYIAGDTYICSTRLSLDSNSESNSVALTSADCVNNRTNNNTFNDLLAIDVSSDARGLQIQIA
jgi:curved DNA-binding protein CbpA